MKTILAASLALSAITACDYSGQKYPYVAYENIQIIESEATDPNIHMEYETITPNIYAIAAQRAVSKMLDDTTDLYYKKDRPKLFIEKTINSNINLPRGLYYSQKMIKDLIVNSETYVVVNNIKDADYILTPEVDTADAYNTVAFEYFLTLYNKDNLSVGKWSEILKRLRNDDNSWW